jgi:hypothetical protein
LLRELAGLDAQEKATAQAQIDAIVQGRSPEVYDRLLSEIDGKRKVLKARLADEEAQKPSAPKINPETDAQLLQCALADAETALTDAEIVTSEKNRLLQTILRSVRPEDDRLWMETEPLRCGETVYHIQTTSCATVNRGIFDTPLTQPRQKNRV